MSNEAGGRRGYKRWLSPNSKEKKPKSTHYDQEQKNIQDIINDVYQSDNSIKDIDLVSHVEEPQLNVSFIDQHPLLIETEHCGVPSLERQNVNCSLVNEIHHLDSLDLNIEDMESFSPDDDWVHSISNAAATTDEENLASENIQKNDEVKIGLRKNNSSETVMLKNSIFLHERIHKKTNTSNGELLLMCMLLAIRHSLTWEALLDIIGLINTIFDEDIINMSKYKLMGLFPDRKDWYTYHVYCPECSYYIGNRADLTSVITCISCGKSQKDPKKCPYFLTLNVKSQLKELFENPLVQPHLNYRTDRKKINDDNIEDVLDGALHKRLSAPGEILSNKMNFSYIFNTDGCQASDSSPVSVWPVFLKLNELPLEIRNKFIVLVGLWVNEEKPTMNIFLPPLVNELNDLSSVGVEWSFHGKPVQSKVIPLGFCVDTPARCSLLNMKQFNGFYGCTFCYHPSEVVEGIRKYPVKQFYSYRSHKTIISDMLATHVRNERTGQVNIEVINGVKGPSALMNLKYFDLVDGMSPDSMHAVYLGVSKQFTEIILSSSGKSYYVGSPNDLAMINRRLASIKAPKCITRTSRSLNLRRLWKASEWRNWLLYYCLPCLFGILQSKYLIHLSKLVSGIEILQQHSISKDDIKLANKLLIEFAMGLEDDFDSIHMTYNVHLLLHMARSVQKIGPLYVQDTFCFENENRLLLHLKKSPTEIAVQISNRYFVYKSIPYFSSLFPIGSRTLEFIDSFENRIKKLAKVDDAVVIGSGKPYVFNDSEQAFNEMENGLSYQKMIYKHHRYATMTYCEKLKIDDSIVELKCGSMGVITNIVVGNISATKVITILYHPIKFKNIKAFGFSHLNHIRECIIDDKAVLTCGPSDIKNQCIMITSIDKKYISSIIQGTLGD